MKNKKLSIYSTLVIIIIFTVVIVMSFQATYSYIQTKNKIINEMKENSRATILSLKNNISTLLSSYAVNEYENLILNEIKGNDIFAIVIEDFNMGKIIGEKSYISGKIKDNKTKIIDYDFTNKIQNEQLKNSYYTDSFDITNINNEKIGIVSIYISDKTMTKELKKIIEESVINTVAISFLLILFLFISIKFFILKPISDIIEVIKNKDHDGIPLQLAKNANSKEIDELSLSINSMIYSIKESRQILKTNENKLTYLLEMSPIAVRIATENGKKVIFSNYAYSKLLGIDKDKALFKNPINYYDDKKVYKDIVKNLKNNKSIYNKLIKLNISNNTVWVLASYMNIEYDGEESIIGWFFDVSNEKENELRLFEALDLQTAIFDNSGYLMIRTDKNGIIKQVNKEVEKLLGYNSEELVDIHTPEFFHVKSEILKKSKELSIELNTDVIDGFNTFVIKSNMNLDNESEWTYLTKDGNQIPVLLSVSALRDKENKIYGYIGISKDITQRKILESQSKLASMGEMIGNIAHQWRQPLSVISTISSGIKVKSEYDQLDMSTLFEDMDNIIKQTKYLSKTIDDFRNFIKDTNTKEKVSILHTIEKTLTIVNSTIVNNHITLIKDLEDDAIIDGFENQLIQAIINIINNSKDALKENNQDMERLLFIETKKINNTLYLSIKDNAGGIPLKILDKIFEPYFTTKHQSIGTGIGLSITHQIITKHHYAFIEAYNKTYKYNNIEYTGAVFQIKFKL
ncbi:MAG: PAS domain S-box protein [Poseidonibacter sp.]|uniref:PAS domain S-box protein n=1 Tax=Poseidonibacter sp. TaxID=2321188 RepID=UPI00359D96E8